jgi:tRNA threonylcarbamoyladenosine modification (KEOPS) complex  Pcc1 subunit
LFPINCTPGPLSSNLIKTEKAVPNKPENKENIKYKVPISFALVDKNHLSVPIDISDLNLLLLKWVSSFFRLIKKKMKVIKVNVL